MPQLRTIWSFNTDRDILLLHLKQASNGTGTSTFIMRDCNYSILTSEAKHVHSTIPHHKTLQTSIILDNASITCLVAKDDCVI